jgi:hypothetical protein
MYADNLQAKSKYLACKLFKRQNKKAHVLRFFSSNCVKIIAVVCSNQPKMRPNLYRSKDVSQAVG